MEQAQANYAYRFGGIGRLYGAAAMARFRVSNVCVIGIGGVGSWTVEALARSGIGRLTLIDLDDVCESNVNRQIHAVDGAIGAPKIEVMAARCRSINPEIQVQTESAFFTQRNAGQLLAHGYDFLIDAIDSAKHKAALIAGCRERRIPIVTVGGAGGKMDPTQIRVDDLARTYNDPLLVQVRKALRRDYGFPRQEKRKFKIDCVFSPEEPRYPEACDMEAPAMQVSSIRLDCSGGYGAVTHLTGTFGFFAASAALKSLAARAGQE